MELEGILQRGRDIARQARALRGTPTEPHNESRKMHEEITVQAKKLSEAEVKENLARAKGWSLVNGRLHRAFECKDFVAAFGNMTQVALVAEAMNHHPEWSNVWNKVIIDLNTHSVKGISNLDFELAGKINEIFGE
jgi:4a-hydroxytetrahydrobiopterin dehydratase